MLRLLIIFIMAGALSAEPSKDTAKKTEPAKTDTKKDSSGKNEPPKEEDKFSKNLTPEEADRIEKEAELKRKEYLPIANFMKKEYVEKAEKDLPKLVAEIPKLERQLAASDSPKNKERIQKEIIELKAQIESLKIWSLYYKAYLIKEEAYDKGIMDKYREAKNYLTKLEAKYLELTSKKFPNVKGVFYAKHGEKAKEIRDKQLNSK